MCLRLDPLPTWLIKDCIDVIAPILTAFINASVRTGVMPDLIKVANITPIIKKPSLNKESFRNYRPVSNIPFTSKLIEKYVDGHIEAHCVQHELNEPLQSAYTKNCSTETALLKIMNDLLLSVDSN